MIALFILMRVARNDLINSNSWQTYESYNSDVTREGRAYTLRLLRETGGKGLPTYAEYRAYFGLDEAPPSEATARRQRERQHLHDLGNFYHQTGVLLWQGRLNRDFTLLLVGPGLEDRWAVMRPLADYYRREGEQEGDFPYGGMYVLYREYLMWKGKRFPALRRAFAKAREATGA